MDRKQKYLTGELWILSWAASVQRARLFRPGVQEPVRRGFRVKVLNYAERELLPQYQEIVPERRHEQNIEHLAEFGSTIGKDVLDADGYRIGTAQKLLNLQLKYLWCLGLVDEPPHCPVDSIVIADTKLRGKVAWTRIRTISEYQEVIAALRVQAESAKMSLARWELFTYQRPGAMAS